MRQFIKTKYLNALLSIVPEREIPKAAREALILRNEHGYTYQLAAIKANTSRKAVKKAEEKIMKMHEVIYAVYVDGNGCGKSGD